MPWPLEAAEAEIELNDLPATYGIEIPQTTPLLHYSRELVVYLWSLDKVLGQAARPGGSGGAHGRDRLIP